MSLRHVRLAQEDKDRLVALKRKTKLTQWNILCRWALAISLHEPSPLTPIDLPADSNVEMTWEVFGGEYGELWLAALRERNRADGLPTDDETLARQLRLHIHRGIGYLSAPGEVRSILDLCRRVSA